MATRFTRRPGAYTSMDFVPITPSDSVDFAQSPCTAIYVGGAGIVQVVRWDDVVVPFTCAAGTLLSVMAKRVNSTSTTASLMVAQY